jgi:hypothetical protein
MSEQGTSIAFYSRLQTLKRKHATLQVEIENEQSRPASADFYLKQLKRQKLFLKDQIEDLVGTLRRNSANA